MRILFVGARVVGHLILERLLAGGSKVVGVLTLDESRSHETTAFRPFDTLLERHHLPHRRFTRLDDETLLPWVRSLDAELGIVAGVSQMIGPPLLAAPARGFIGMHPTLLPEGRGRAPIPWAIIKGLTRSGVSWFQCGPEADAGPLWAQREIPLHYEDTCATLGARSDTVAAELLLELLPRIAAGAAPTAQDETRASRWSRRTPEEGAIDWRRDGRALYDWVRALTHPYPGAFTQAIGRRLWVWEARESRDRRHGRPGEVVALLPHGVLVACGDGCLLLTRLQWEGAAEVSAAQAGLAVGERLGG